MVSTSGSDDSSQVDPFELMGCMVADADCEPLVDDLIDERFSGDNSAVIANGATEIAAAFEIETTDEDAITAVSCFEFWERQVSGPSLVENLSRHMTDLRSHGFQLPWMCKICRAINTSWLGACEECKSGHDVFQCCFRKSLACRAECDRGECEHVLLALALCCGPQEVEACFLFCEAMAVPPARGSSLYRRAFRLWPQLDTYIFPDGVPSALREEADAIIASRSRSCMQDSSGDGAPGIFPSHWKSLHWIGVSPEKTTELQQRCDCVHEKGARIVVVYSYHQEDGGPPVDWFGQAVRSASSLKTLHADHLPYFELWVISNVDTSTADVANVFDEHLMINLAKESGLQHGGRSLCGTKIQAIIHCLEQGCDKVVYMDSDTHVLRPFLSPMLAALDFYDVTGVFEGPPLGMAQSGLDPILADPRNQAFGFELNTGVLGVRGSALQLCMAWLAEFRSHSTKYASVSSADQPALMQVLRHRTERVFPLPPIINFRPYTVFSPSGPSMPLVIHDHGSDSTKCHADITRAVCDHLHYGLRWKP